ncbi:MULTISPECIES: hypothetical protein [Sphingobacterium]|uniref:hypothetical protein n=1 Tax=Sphingobacterium TaxID=28453 RepID=UPI0013E4DDEF|nr:hypothetical protein [Sphingobacterium sp. DR205]QIH31508.1 hypothetical protein G6053_00665 [Sphingobacterium sp. DR205]
MSFVSKNELVFREKNQILEIQKHKNMQKRNPETFATVFHYYFLLFSLSLCLMEKLLHNQGTKYPIAQTKRL